MVLNIVFLLIGAAFVFYGVKNKLKFWIVIGGFLLCLSLISACIDYKMGGIENGVNDINHRIPFIIDHAVK